MFALTFLFSCFIFYRKEFLSERRFMIVSTQETMINWFPGHMAKARRLLSDQVQKADLILELCDARIPFSSRNPDLDALSRGKKRLLLLNKADLADPGETKKWVSFFQRSGLEAFPVDSLKLKNKEMLSLLSQATKAITEKALSRGIRKTVRAMVVGVPNVGKSTLINHLHGSGVVQTGDRPGVTRSNHWVRITPYLELMDSPGLLWPRLDDQQAARRLCYIGSVKDDVVDLEMLAIRLLEDLKEICPEAVKSRFHLESLDFSGAELLEAVCRGRGWLLKGNRYDYDRACRVILDEFRGGKLGRITLESPKKTEEKLDDRQDGPLDGADGL